MKAIKLILALLLGVLLLIGAVLAAIVTLLDPNDYKDQIHQAALEQAGIELNIDGDIAWSLYPWLALELNSVGVRYPDRPALGTLHRAEVAISIPALIGGELQMNRLLVDRLQLDLVQAADGSNNWTPAASAAPRSSSADTPATDGQDGDARKPLMLNIEAVEVRDAALTYTDAREDRRIELSELNLTTGQIVIGQAFPLELSATLRQFAGEQLQLHSSASLTTTLTLGLADSHILLEDLSSRLNVLQGAGLPKAITLALDADVDARLNEQQVDVRNLAINLEPVALAGELQLHNFSQPELSGRLSSNTFNLKQLLTTLGQAVPATAAPDALTAVAFEATLGGPAGTLALKPMSLQLDDTRLDGDASLALASGAIAVTLKGNALDADRYLPPATATTAADGGSQTPASAQTDSQEWSKDEILPVAPLRALNLSANLDLDSLKINGITLGQPGLSLNAANGLIRLTRFSARAFEGQIQATARLDARQTPVQLNIAPQISRLAMAPLLKTLANNDSLAGTFNARADLNLRGQSVHAWINSLTGSASLSMAEGLIKGIDAAQSMCQGINNLSALWLNAEQVDQTTPFADLSATFKLRNGVVSNNDLSAKLDAMRVAGSGRINLPPRALDYRIGATIEDNLFNQSCSVNNRLEGVEIPVNCTGSFSDAPAKLCRLDTRFIGDLLKAEARRKVEEKVGTQLEEKLKEKLGEEGAGKVLQGLFGR